MSCFCCGSNSKQSLNKDNCPIELLTTIQSLQECFNKKTLQSRSTICLGCVYQVQTWGEIIQQALGKKLISKEENAPTKKSVSFSPVKTYINEDRTSPLNLSSSSEQESLISKNKTQRPKHKSLRLVLKDLKSVETFMKEDKRRLIVPEIEDTKMLKEIAYILIRKNSQISDSILNDKLRNLNQCESPKTKAALKEMPRRLISRELFENKGASNKNNDAVKKLTTPTKAALKEIPKALVRTNKGKVIKIKSSDLFGFQKRDSPVLSGRKRRRDRSVSIQKRSVSSEDEKMDVEETSSEEKSTEETTAEESCNEEHCNEEHHNKEHHNEDIFSEENSNEERSCEENFATDDLEKVSI